MIDYQTAMEQLNIIKDFGWNKEIIDSIDTAIFVIQEALEEQGDGQTKTEHWEEEAKKQAAAAGEFRIALEERLKQITDCAAGIAELAASAKSYMDHIVLGWKLAQLEEQEAWIRKTLGRRPGQ